MGLTGAIGAGRASTPGQKAWICVQVLPRELADVVRKGKALAKVANLGGAQDDAPGYESLHGAILEAERVRTRLAGHVAAENLLFVFGESLQALKDFPLVLPLPPPLAEDVDDLDSEAGGEDGQDGQEPQPEHKAIVLCKVENSEALEEWFGGKEKYGRHGTKRYEVTWLELQECKRRLSDVGKHVPTITEAE